MSVITCPSLWEESHDIEPNFNYTFKAYLLDKETPLFQNDHYDSLAPNKPIGLDNFSTSVIVYWVSVLDSKPQLNVFMLTELNDAYASALESHGFPKPSLESRMIEIEKLSSQLKVSVEREWKKDMDEDKAFSLGGWAGEPDHRELELFLMPAEKDGRLSGKAEEFLFQHCHTLNAGDWRYHSAEMNVDTLDGLPTGGQLDAYFSSPGNPSGAPMQVSIARSHGADTPPSDRFGLSSISTECLPVFWQLMKTMIVPAAEFSQPTIEFLVEFSKTVWRYQDRSES